MGNLSGQQIKGYELREQIGAGGFGAVYRAAQPVVGREVAIKVILPQYANHPDFIRRFEMEAQLVARLEHMNIVPLYDYWRDPDGAYLVMRYLRGGSLRDRLKTGPLSLVETARLVDQMAAALTVAHRNGVIHRDLKPANILLDEEGNAYLTDFGIAKALLQPGDTSQTGQIIGSPAYLSPEQIKAETVSPQTDLYCLGLVIYEAIAGRMPYTGDISPTALLYKQLSEPLPTLTGTRPDLPVALDGMLRQATAKNPAERYSNASQMAGAFRKAVQLTQDIVVLSDVSLATLRSNDTRDVRDTDTMLVDVTPSIGSAMTNPYKGLRAFQEADTPDFFGREALTERLVARMAEDHPVARFLAIVGPSGSGKSSVAKAGLIPALRRGALPESDQWFYAEMLPGAHPLDELEVALLRVASKQPSNLNEQLRRDERGLARAAKLILPDNGQLVLLIDQFEEVFMLAEDVTQARHFLDLIFATMSEARSQVRIIITLRADFYDRPLMYPNFSDLMRQRTEVVIPLNPAELESAIVRPIQRINVSAEPKLIAAVINEVSQQPGALPMLQYALTELFEHRQDNRLTLDAYHAQGGVMGVLAKRADEVHDRLTPEQQTAAVQLFLRLVTLGEGTEDTRRRARQAELLSLHGDAMNTVLEAFGQSRLLTFDRDPLTREPTVEVAHEAIIREWQRLRTWLDDSRSDIRQQRMLAASAQEWLQSKRDPSYLLSGSRLAQFEGWAVKTNVALTPDERAYLETCVTEQKQQVSRQRRLRNVILVAAIVAIVIMTILTIVVFDRETKAEREAAVNHSLVLASSARDNQTAGYSDLALQLALTAATIENPPVEIQNILHDIAFAPGTRAVLTGHSQDVRAVAFNPDGKLGLSGSCAVLTADKVCTGGELILWDLQKNVQIRRMEGHTGWVNRVAFSPDSQTAISASDDHNLILWNVATGLVIRRFEGHTDKVNSVVFSPDGKTAISASSDKTLILWDVVTGAIVRQFQGHTAGVNSVVVSPDGKTIISGSDDMTAVRWDIATGAILMRYAKHTGAVVDLAISPDGHTFLSSGTDGDFRLWDVESGASLNRAVFPNPPIGLNFTPDGKSFTYVSGTSLALMSIAKWVYTDSFGGHSAPVLSSAISADGRFVLTGSADKTVRLWNLKNQAAYRVFESVDELQLGVIVFSPDHRSVLSGTEKGHVLMWNIATGKITRRFDLGQTIGVFNIAFTPDGKYMAVGAGAFAGDPYLGSLTLWDFNTGQIVRRFEGQKGWISGLAFSPDGLTLLSSSSYGTTDGGELVLWDVTMGTILRRFDNHENVMYVTLSADGRQAITGSWSFYHAILWDVATGKEIRRFDGVHTDIAPFAVFVPGDKTVVTSSYDGLLQEWDVATGKKLRRFTDSNSVFGVSFSSDRHYMVNGNGSGIATFWNFQTGDMLQRLDANTILPDFKQNYVWSTIFDSSNKHVYFIVGDSALHKIVPIEWSVSVPSIDELKAWIKANRYVRDLTCDERAHYKIEPLCGVGTP